MSASVVIQSWSCVIRCLAARSGSTDAARNQYWAHLNNIVSQDSLRIDNPGALTKAVNANSLSRWEIHHLALKCKVVARSRTAKDLFARRTYNFNLEVV